MDNLFKIVVTRPRSDVTAIDVKGIPMDTLFVVTRPRSDVTAIEVYKVFNSSFWL